MFIPEPVPNDVHVEHHRQGFRRRLTRLIGPHEHAPLPKHLRQLCVIYAKLGEKKLVLLPGIRAAQLLLGVLRRQVLLVHEGPEARVVKVVDVRVGLPPREVVTHVPHGWVAHAAGIEHGGVLEGDVLAKKVLPEVHKRAGKQRHHICG